MVLSKEQVEQNLKARRKLVTLDELGGDVYLSPMSARDHIDFGRKLIKEGLLDETLGEDAEFNPSTATDDQVNKFVSIAAQYLHKIIVDDNGDQLLTLDQAATLSVATIETVFEEMPAKKKVSGDRPPRSLD